MRADDLFGVDRRGVEVGDSFLHSLTVARVTQYAFAIHAESVAGSAVVAAVMLVASLPLSRWLLADFAYIRHGRGSLAEGDTKLGGFLLAQIDFGCSG